jgi:hypothetical protein
LQRVTYFNKKGKKREKKKEKVDPCGGKGSDNRIRVDRFEESRFIQATSSSRGMTVLGGRGAGLIRMGYPFFNGGKDSVE